MALISNLSVGITANMRPLQRGLTRTRRQIRGFVRSVANIKTAIVGAIGGAAIGAVLKKSLDAWKSQEQAVASLQSANDSMGRSAGGMTKKMIALAGQLSKEGIFSDGDIISGMAVLSTYSQITDDLMPRATQAMLDYAAKSGSAMPEAANKIGKAAMGMAGELREVGITMSAETDRAIALSRKNKAIQEGNVQALRDSVGSSPVILNFDGKGLSESAMAALELNRELKKLAANAESNLRGASDATEIFKLILTDLEQQVGGTNKALGDTGTGGIEQFTMALGEINEKLGQGVSGAISPWARQFAIDMGLINIDAENLGVQWRNTMRNLVHSSIPFLNALGGIKLAVKTLELAFGGFELFTLTVFKSLASGVSSVAGFFGMDTAGADEALRGLNKDFHNQLAVVKSIKKELGSIYDDVENKQFGKDLLKSFNDFDNRAKKTFEGLKNPKVTPEVFASKPTNNFSIKSGDTAGGDVRPLFPKVDRTNEILGMINTNIGRNVARAG
jgi:hypothetical protein